MTRIMRRNIICRIALLLLLLSPPATIAARDTRTVSIDFPINSAGINADYSGNAASLKELHWLIDETVNDTAITLDTITVSGYASPDGSLAKNKELSLRRAFSIINYLEKECGVNDSVIVLGENIVPWDKFRDMLSSSDYPWRNEALQILSVGNDDSAADNTRRMNRLKKLASGKAWSELKNEVLPLLRRAIVVTVITNDAPATVPADDAADAGLQQDGAELHDAETANNVAADTVANEGIADDAENEPTPCAKGWQLSTNALEWGLLISNIQGEWDFACNWSLNMSVHYSAVNYFTSTRKFRTFILRPELRYWFGSNHRGLFIDGHVQMAAYNFALSHWKYRIQDVDGKHPALGGGLGIGYRLPLGKSGRWALEAAIGAGVYHLKYNRFENRHNGQLVDTRSRTWCGIDNVAISLVYNFSNTLSR